MIPIPRYKTIGRLIAVFLELLLALITGHTAGGPFMRWSLVLLCAYLPRATSFQPVLWGVGQCLSSRKSAISAHHAPSVPAPVEKEPSPAEAKTRRAQAIPAFRAWLKRRQAEISPVKLAESQGPGLGLYSTRFIEKDHILATIPQDVLITAKLSEPLATLANATGLDAIARIALRLAYEKSLGKASCFAPYVAVLPSLFELQLPLLWSDEDVKLLKPSALYDDITEMRQRAAEQFRAIRVALEEGSGCLSEQQRSQLDALRKAWEWELWTWALALSNSRPFLMDEKDDDSLTLIPLVDMANHDDSVKYSIQKGDGVFSDYGSIVLLSDRDYKPGEEVSITYGPLSSNTKFASFGYVPALHNDSDMPAQGAATLIFELPESDPLYRKKCDILEAVGVAPKGHRFEVGIVTKMAHEDNGTARVALDNEEALNDVWRFQRLKHLDDEGLEAQKGPEGPAGVWRRLGSCTRRTEVEGLAAAEIVTATSAVLKSVKPQLQAVKTVEGAIRKKHAAGQVGDPVQEAVVKERLGMVKLLLHGEILALRAVAELAMAEIEGKIGK